MNHQVNHHDITMITTSPLVNHSPPVDQPQALRSLRTDDLSKALPAAVLDAKAAAQEGGHLQALDGAGRHQAVFKMVDEW